MSAPMWPRKRARARALAAALGDLGRARCLELAEQDGRLGAGLADRGGQWVRAVLGRLEGAAPGRAVAVGVPLPFIDGAFEVVVLADVLAHVPDDRALMAEAVRCLAPGGRLLVTAPLRPHPALGRLARALGLGDAHFGHRHPGYVPGSLLALFAAAGAQVEAVRTPGGFLDEALELVANALLARWRRPGRASPAVPRAGDWRGWRGLAARAIGAVLRVVTLVDRLPVMAVAGTAVVCARKAAVPLAEGRK